MQLAGVFICFYLARRNPVLQLMEQSLISNSRGTIITRVHYHNKPSTPTHMSDWFHAHSLVDIPKATYSADSGGLGRPPDNVPTTNMSR